MTNPENDETSAGRRQRRVGTWTLLSVILVLVAGALVTLSILDKRDSPTPVALSLPLLDVADQSWSFEEHRGTPVVINFWASWCTPCRTEMPELDRIAQDLGERLEVIGINVMDDRSAALALAEQLDISYPLLVDPTAEVMRTFGVSGLPTTVLVDYNGQVVMKATGRPTGDELRQMIADHLGVPV